MGCLGTVFILSLCRCWPYFQQFNLYVFIWTFFSNNKNTADLKLRRLFFKNMALQNIINVIIKYMC